jgi:hypothetical protein
LHCLNGVSEWCSSKSVTFERKKNTLHGVVNFTRMSISKKKGDVVKTYMCVVVAVLRV